MAEAGSAVTPHGLMVICALAEVHGLIVSGPRRAGEHTYAAMADRVPAPRLLDATEARSELARRYVRGHGPVTERDLAYWAQWPLGHARAALSAVEEDLSSFELDGRRFWHAADQEPTAGSGRGHLLQVLDEYYRGYQDSRSLLDLAGLKPVGREPQIGMAVVDSQVVAGMTRQVTDATVAFELHPLRRLTRADRSALDEAAVRYAAFLGRSPTLTVLG
ncbi:MAG: crosslink repair DNA glycosylase YcaQ family protein [Nocardioides sp.]